MEDENNISQEINNNPQQTVSITKNIFLYDGPVNRLWFIVTILGIFIVSFIFLIIFAFLHEMYGEISNIPVFIAVLSVYALIILYISILNYSKRVYDIIADKQKAMFYTIAIFIANFATGFIPVVKYIWTAAAMIIFITLLVLPGKLLK